MRIAFFAAVLVIAAGAWTVGKMLGSSYVKYELSVWQQRANDGMGNLTIGDTLPDWHFETVDSNKVKLSSYISGNSLLFLLEPQCSSCIDGIRLTTSLAGGREDARIIIISSGERSTLMELQTLIGFKFPILIDSKRDFSWHLGISRYPMYIFVDSNLIVKEIVPGNVSMDDYIHNFIRQQENSEPSRQSARY